MKETTALIKSWRAKLGKTQRDVSKYLNVTENTYYKYEKDMFTCKTDILFKLIDYLNGNKDEFFNALEQDYLSRLETKKGE